MIEGVGLPAAMETTGAIGLLGTVGLYAVLPWRRAVDARRPAEMTVRDPQSLTQANSVRP